MKKNEKLETYAVVLGTMSAIGVVAALVSAAVGSSIAAIICVSLTSCAAITAAVLESIRLTK